MFREAERGPGGVVRVDFLTGTMTGGSGGNAFRRVVDAFTAAVPRLCQRHGTSEAAFERLEGLFLSEARGRRFVVTVQDRNGRLAMDEYDSHGTRLRVLHNLGRPRRKRGCTNAR